MDSSNPQGQQQDDSGMGGFSGSWSFQYDDTTPATPVTPVTPAPPVQPVQPQPAPLSPNGGFGMTPPPVQPQTPGFSNGYGAAPQQQMPAPRPAAPAYMPPAQQPAPTQGFGGYTPPPPPVQPAMPQNNGFGGYNPPPPAQPFGGYTPPPAQTGGFGSYTPPAPRPMMPPPPMGGGFGGGGFNDGFGGGGFGGAKPDPALANYKFWDHMKDFKTTIKIPAHSLKFDEAYFIKLLAGSISLTRDEKKRIVDSIPKLRQEQVDELGFVIMSLK